MELFLVPTSAGVAKTVVCANSLCGLVLIKDALLLIEKSSLCDGSGFPLSLSKWSDAI